MAGKIKEATSAAASVIEEAPAASMRRERLAQATADVAPSHFVPLPYGLKKVPVAWVPQSMLLYRVDNGRLVAELEQHLRTQGRNWNDLRAQAETAEVQRLLHGFLMAAAADERGPILQELERQRQQTEPLLVDALGVVINGNRRLAAMRTLLQRDAQKFATFSEIAIAVLPADVSAADTDFIEAALQMAPETKLGYGWLNRRIKLRRQRDDLKLPEKWILEAYQLADRAQLKREIEELALAEDYLQRRGIAGHYSDIADTELLFVGLADQLGRLPERVRAIWRDIGFSLIAARAQFDAPLDRSFPFVAPVPPELPTATLRHLACDGQEAMSEAQLSEAELEDLRLRFSPAKPSAPELQDVLELMALLRAEHNERAKPGIVLDRIRSVRRKMDRLDPGRLTQAQRNALRSEIAAIHAQAAYLLGENPENRFEQRKTGLVKAAGSVLRRWREKGRGT